MLQPAPGLTAYAHQKIRDAPILDSFLIFFSKGKSLFKTISYDLDKIMIRLGLYVYVTCVGIRLRNYLLLVSNYFGVNYNFVSEYYRPTCSYTKCRYLDRQSMGVFIR